MDVPEYISLYDFSWVPQVLNKMSSCPHRVGSSQNWKTHISLGPWCFLLLGLKRPFGRMCTSRAAAWLERSVVTVQVPNHYLCLQLLAFQKALSPCCLLCGPDFTLSYLHVSDAEFGRRTAVTPGPEPPCASVAFASHRHSRAVRTL